MKNPHLKNREIILRQLREELVGPSPQGEELDCSVPIQFQTVKDSYGPWRQRSNGEEILQRDPPTKRYGVGVLYPMETSTDDTLDGGQASAIGMYGKSAEETSETELEADFISKEAQEELETAAAGLDQGLGITENSNDLDLTTSNTYRPSSIGVTFLAKLYPETKIQVSGSMGRYRPVEIVITDRASGRTSIKWWLREPVVFTKEIGAVAHSSRVKLETSDNVGPIDAYIEVFFRTNPHGADPDEKLITVCLVNRTQFNGHQDEHCLFQAGFQVTLLSPSGAHQILPYPEPPSSKLDDEEKSLALLYRDFRTYAIGHGCAADWTEKDTAGNVKAVLAECLPTFETPSTTPDIEDKNGNPIRISMAVLAGLVPENDGFADLEGLVTLYEEWIDDKKADIANLPSDLQKVAESHLQACSRCASRMRAGIDYLQEEPQALKAFQLANHAILLQQLTARSIRKAEYNGKTNRWEFSHQYVEPDVNSITARQREWRAFQIAFLLMTIKSSAEGWDEDRKTVELIWFPTGGGKTEAYLGLAAFSLFMRRLADSNDVGVHVITRYTLRLLTTQQFQRAAKLICAMEWLRNIHPELGATRFTIGIWVGSDNTPNTRTEAKNNLNELRKKWNAKNSFIIGQCPWCGAEMGQIKQDRKPDVIGYIPRGNTVVYQCSDDKCPFHSHLLPIYSIDEDIYDFRPSMVIGTVDKFATLVWQPKARALFGIAEDGKRAISPPGLIIQDELHLISGPLGSMVGLYEAVIEELCTDYRGDRPIPPKIISSTATIRRYREQIKALYARQDVVLFPPSGLDIDDSFFAKYARNKETGKLEPGRLYVGVHGPSLGSLQTVQVRAFTSLTQAPMNLTEFSHRDPWWSLLVFFNSLRELGTTLSLFQSDIPDYFAVTANRSGTLYGQMRKLRRIRELTGRLRSDEVPQAITDLEIAYKDDQDKNSPVDVCLASNILEVGVDIDRLSLMAVVGQPKSTSQYIQVTGRVGRKWWERPGLVVTIYTASKPRDRSHFEKFRSYHERLYAQVEPTSVTPFSPPALDRALHAIMALYVRQNGSENCKPYPYPSEILLRLREILLARVSIVDDAERKNLEAVFDRRVHEWQRWERTTWEKNASDDNFLLLRAGQYADPIVRRTSWPTPSSMRSVDAECEAQVTQLYVLED